MSTKQQTIIAKPRNPVILSGTERRRREVKSKLSRVAGVRAPQARSEGPEVASVTMKLQGVLTNIYPLFRSSKPLSHHRVSCRTTFPATTISTQRSQANQ